MGKLKRNALTALILSSLASAPGYAIAQDSPPPPAPAPAATPAEPAKEPATLEGVVVSGEIIYRNRTDTTAPELVYDQEFFAQFEPVSVGDQLRRVPGVAFTSDIGESDSPQLRGLGQGYTQVLVNGRPLPGAGNDRTVFVDRIPAEIVDRIEIIRSPSADIDSQGVGGTINIILKDGASLPPGVIARVGATYNVEAGNTRGNASASWSGRNEAEDVFWSLTFDAQERYNNKDVVQEVFEEDSVGFEDEVASGGIGRGLVKFDDPESSSAVERVEDQDSRDTRDLSFNGDVTWNISERSSLRLDAFFVSTDRKEHEDTLIFEGDGSVGGLELDDPEFEFQDAHFKQDSGGIAGVFEHQVGDASKLELSASFSKFTDDSVEETFEEEEDNLVERESIQTDDTEWTYGISFTSELAGFANSMGIDGAELKFGLSGKTKDRDFRLTTDEDLDDDDYETNDGFFDYEERRLDAYARMKFVFNPAVTLEAGLRAESTDTEQDFRTDFLEGGELDESVSGSADGSEFMLNPSAHLQWKLTDNDQLRFSVAKTVRRPSIEQLIPAYSVESPGDEDVTIGNPDLDFETALGFDVGYERRFGRNGVFGINFFYRDIEDLIGLVRTGVPVSEIGLDDEDFPGGLYTYENIGEAKTHGFEFDLSTPLSFIGLDETGVFANYTRLWSDRDNPDGSGDKIMIDFQPKYVYNVGITQNIPSWDASFGFSYQKQGESRFVTYGEIESQLYDGNLEFFAEKRIGKRAVLRLTGNNLLNAASKQAEAGFDGDNGEEILENQADYNVDAFEVEREKSSPRWTLTLRLVF
jgi:outer membrane receptor protein involved in Fe transport